MFDSEEFSFAVLAVFFVLLVLLAIVGASFLFSDYRKFDYIQKECVDHGYIQNNVTRILCDIEKKEQK